ncbi:uncharacterized protein [Chironomus tepperi]|uniref:uncharacterized protein n=1 Tax=Chironomus tepperi TaxID=113505 RepID=UPI00391FB3E8
MSKFLLTNVEQAHHERCQDECNVREGDMLKCMNLTAEGNKPCNNVIHVTCAGYNSNIVPHLTTYYCTDCTTGSSALHQKFQEIEERARKAAEYASSSSSSISSAEYEEIKRVAERLAEQLKEKVDKLTQQSAELEAQRAISMKQQMELRQLQEAVSSISLERSRSGSNLVPPIHSRGQFHSTFIDRLNDTLRLAEGVEDTTQIPQASIPIPMNIPSNHATNVSSINNSTFNASNTSNGWPNYEEQQRVADQYDDHRLMLLRSSLAKPVPFDGDVTKWATFLSEFVRTSVRGSFRDFEDMDRLRDLIKGEAREMFVTELSDPCAEALATLKRLDDFFGVRGNAVRVAMDRITQLPRVDKATDKQKLTGLYTQSKQFALQCRIHNQQHELASQAILFIIESKMFSDHVKSWRQWTKTNNRSEDIDGVIAYLEEQIRDLSFKNNRPKPIVNANVNAIEVTGGLCDGGTQPSSSTSSSSSKSQDKRKKGSGKRKNRYANCECFLCKQKHPFYKCPELISYNDAKRLEVINRLQVCSRCLCSNKHKIEDCPNRCLRCYITGCEVKNRHPLLHGHSNEQLPSFTTTSANIHTRFLQTVSHFPMVPGHVVAVDGKLIPVTIMYDSGSGISLATHSLFEQAKYNSQMDYELNLRWATDIEHTDTQAKLFDLNFLPSGKTKPIVIKNVTATQSLNLPEQEQDPETIKRRFPYLKDVPLPCYSQQVPQILLGLTHANLMAHLSSVCGQDGDPVAALTPLGWVLYGSCFDPCDRANPVLLGFTCQIDTPDVSNDDLLRYIRSCNDVESIGIAHKNASLLSAEDQQAEKVIKATTKFIPGKGRYETGLLWAHENITMPDNYQEAVNRLISIEKRLVKLDMLDFVNKQFKEQINNGWLIETTREEANKHPRRNYVYGFLVFNKNKSPPKPRWVNDTAACFKGISLNSQLLKGPDNLVPLPQSMCSLREGQIAYQADVKSMFNQNLLNEEDQYSQLTLWREGDSSKEPKIYRQTRVIFGPTSSPSVTSAIRIDHAKNCKAEFPEASDVAINQMYVDDAPDSRDTVQEATKVAKDLICMFSKIGWPLVEFQSNSKELLDNLPKDHVSKKMSEIANDQEELITKVLGIFWKPQTDVYVYRLNDDSMIKKVVEQDYTPTKKEMLSTVMRIFDPLGQIAPFRIRGHMIMQHVWRAGTDWKKKPPSDICEEFKKWLKDFNDVAKLEIPRSYSQFPLRDCEVTLHVFVDAGTEAYAACAYIRVQHGDSVTIRLIAAKARVAPLKYMSIPRLELMSGLIGARLLKSVMQWHRRIKFVDYNCWTDSDIVFKWIKTHHLPRTAFTAPRIAEIQELTSADKWRYVPSKQNVADYATKERSIDYSNSAHEWFNGPAFLYEHPDKWPKQPSTSVTKKIEVNVAISKISNNKLESIQNVLTEISAKVRANWPVLIRVIAKALRFADYLIPQMPKLRRTGQFTNSEISRAENYVIREVQKVVFAEEWKSLQKEGKVKKTSQLSSLSPFFCNQTLLIRATTRLSSNFPLNTRAPPILPNFHEITDSIVNHYHKINLHVGDNSIIAQMRSRVWIINAKRAVRRCRARCLYCLKKRIRPSSPRMADLPDFRLDINNKPFFHTGCDLFGPFTVYVGRSRRKIDVHVVIFTCMVTRAVYFEILDDKSTANFLVALDKLWARRGPISHIYSDNGLNFVGAAKVIDKDQLEKGTADKRIIWHFNPPYTPTWGGAWERLIKDVKRGLEASLGKFTVPRLSMEAALARIEANLNNRPLTEVPVSSMDEIPLSPYILMTGYQNYPAFRHRFISEYAPIITRRPVNSALAKYSLKLNDYVCYMDPTKNPSLWNRGIICKVYPGKDFAIRVADIKLKDGTILEKRPAHLIAKIDIRLEEPEAETKKYASCSLLVKKYLNFIYTKGAKTIQQQNQNIYTKCQKMQSERAIILNKFASKGNDKLEVAKNIQLNDEQKEEFIGKSGRKIIYANNFPPKFAASDVFSVMSEFGVVKLIASSNWNGIKPFSCFVGFEDEASVQTALMWSESQAICTNNIAYKQTFTVLRKHFNKIKTIVKPMYAFLDLQVPNNLPTRTLLITTSISDARGFHKPIPINSDCGGILAVCSRSQKYDFSTTSIDMSKGDVDVQRLPTIPKPDEFMPTKNDTKAKKRKVSVHNGNIIINFGTNESLETEFNSATNHQPDLREIIEKRKELKNIRNKICTNKRSRK